MAQVTRLSGRRAAASISLVPPPVAIAHLFGVYLCTLFVFLVVTPTLDQQFVVLDSRFLFDSIAYFRQSHDFVAQTIFSVRLDYSSDGLFPSLGLTNSLVVLEGRVALALFPGAPHLAILAMNYAVFALALRNARKLAEVLGLAWTQRVQLLIALNPFIWMNLVTLTKEVWGMFFVSAFALAAVRRRVLSLVVLGVLSMLVRESYLFLAPGMFLAVVLPGRRALWFPVVVSIVVGVAHMFLGGENVVPFADSKSAALDQRSAEIMQAMAQLQGYPLGHLLAAPIVLLINIISPALHLSYYQASVGNLYNVTDAASSLLFIGVIVVGILRVRRSAAAGRLRSGHVILRLLVAFATLVTLFPISQHRYLLPAYPLLVLWAFAEPLARRGPVPYPTVLRQLAVTAGARARPS